MKRWVSLLLSLVFAIALVTNALAVTPEATEAANALYCQGLFYGTGIDANGNPKFDLDRAPTRHEAVTMLVRLLGKENEAKSKTWTMPFTDVAEWAKPYVGYAYANSLTGGTSVTTFSGNDTVTASQYITFVLRALGYESGTDFQWDKAWELSDKIGLTDGQYNANTVNFTRGDVAVISHRTLQTCMKGTSFTLLEGLANGGNIGESLNTVENTVVNNISKEDLESLLKYYIAVVDLIEAIPQAIQKCNEATSVKELDVSVRTACVLASSSIAGWNNMYEICGNFDDTQALKKYMGEICSTFNVLSKKNEQNPPFYLSDTLNDCLSYLEEFGVGLQQISNSWESAKGEIKSLVEKNS